MRTDFLFGKLTHRTLDFLLLFAEFKIQKAPPPVIGQSENFTIERRESVKLEPFAAQPAFRGPMLKFEGTMKRLPARLTGAHLAICGMLLLSSPCFAASKKDEPVTSSIRIRMDKAGCKVELDDEPTSETGEDGALILTGVEPGDHYLHVDCPGQREKAFFVSPAVGKESTVTPDMAIAGNEAKQQTPLEAAEAHTKLRQAVQQAVRLRARGEFDEAVKLLHEATRLDPENSDLHRELGITFLLARQWARARIEMLEAIRHDPQDADAHNGLGYAIEKLGDLDRAVKEYRTATNLEPDDASYREHYIEALAKIAARQEAAKRK